MSTQIKELSKENNENLLEISGKYRLLNLHEILKVASEEGFGVAAINIRSKYILDAALRAAFVEKSPLIVEIAESEADYCNISPERLAEMLKLKTEALVAEFGYMIPLCLHMDHIQKDLELVARAIKAGFSSVACDQSKKHLEENIKITKLIVDKCHAYGVSVEGEIGELGAAQALSDPDLQKNLVNYVPTVEEASRFVKETGIDAFAGFFGNGHGQYMDTPDITWDRIKDIKEALREEGFSTPLVLHGGSYLETHDFDRIQVFVQAIRCGCYKFNYATTVSDIMKDYLPKDILAEMEESVDKAGDWRKALGKFEGKIDAIDNKRLDNMRVAMMYHLRMMIKYAWLSSERVDEYDAVLV
ncbi:class II fructose-bisphosphate aldolase [Patescibacteria group bacterium]|nr:class II fructose-bisphosphate aldolase [Patescibacteria group bacterium]